MQAVCIHSEFGRGRTGTMLACYLVAREGYSGDKAISEIRAKREDSIKMFSSQQEQAIKDFAGKN